jgi:hypothetical protein
LKRIATALLAALLGSCSSDPMSGGGIETTTGSVAGRIQLGDGSALVHTRVDLRDSGGGRSLSDTTDSLGRFQFVDVPFGTWKLRARLFKADTFLAEASFRLDAAHPQARIDSLVVVPVVHMRMRILDPHGGVAIGARVFFADSSCFAPFDPWASDPGSCRVRKETSDSTGIVELDDLPASTWYLTATANQNLSARRVFRMLHGGGIWQLGDLSLDTSLARWDVRQYGRLAPFARLQLGNGATSSWDEQQRVLADDSGRLWLDKGLDLYQQSWVVFLGDSLLAEGFLQDSLPRGFNVDLGRSEMRKIDLSTGGSRLSDSGNPIDILSVSRLNHATPRTAPGADLSPSIGPFRVGGPWDLRISYRCHDRANRDSTWIQTWGGILQRPALDPGTWASTSCTRP